MEGCLADTWSDYEFKSLSWISDGCLGYDDCVLEGIQTNTGLYLQVGVYVDNFADNWWVIWFWEISDKCPSVFVVRGGNIANTGLYLALWEYLTDTRLYFFFEFLWTYPIYLLDFGSVGDDGRCWLYLGFEGLERYLIDSWRWGI